MLSSDCPCASAPSSSPASCPRCNVTANPCVASVGCDRGRCTAPTLEPDGTPCVTTDINVHTVSGFCSSGVCQTATQAAYINSVQHESIWFPAGDEAAAAKRLTLPQVAEGLAKGSKEKYVVTALAYWQQTARQSKSCSFNNGGCGVNLCAVNFKTPRKTYCVDAKGESAVQGDPYSDSRMITCAITIHDCSASLIISHCCELQPCSTALRAVPCTCNARFHQPFSSEWQGSAVTFSSHDEG